MFGDSSGAAKGMNSPYQNSDSPRQYEQINVRYYSIAPGARRHFRP